MKKGSNMKKAAFFDRDGVLNKDINYLYRKEDLIWIPGAKQALRRCCELGYLICVVTNQSGIARGYFSEEDMHELHKHMSHELANADISTIHFYHCPHLPPPDGKTPPYNIVCSCRKPLPGLIIKAQEEHNLDLSNSFLVGDSPRDLQCAEDAGVSAAYLFKEENLYEFLQKNEVFRQ
jgi:D-glycero-D-manno-heptose 1,7-bisphosphate phosphatase